MKTTEKRVAGPRRLHVMYFVDSGAAKSFAVRLGYLKAGAVALASLLLGFGISVVLIVGLFDQLGHLQTQIRHLKAASVASAIVSDNLLREAPVLLAASGQHMVNTRSQDVAQALLFGRAVTANSEEGRDEEPADENGSGEPLAMAPAPATANRIATSPAPAAAAAAAALAPQAPLKPDKAVASQPQQPPQTIAPVLASNPPVAAKTPSDAAQATSSSEPPPRVLAKSELSQNKEVAFANLRANFVEGSDTLTLRFDVRKESKGETAIEGRLCALVRGKDAEGRSVVLSYPKRSSPKSVDSSACHKGFPIRFARFRPSKIDFTTPPFELESARLILVTKGQAFEQDYRFPKK